MRYTCNRDHFDNGEPLCVNFGGVPVDTAISEEVLKVVRPAALDAAVAAGVEATQRRSELARALRTELEEARYVAERTRRQYDASDPENRLVTAALEARWNTALKRVAELEHRLDAEETSCHADAIPTAEEFRDLARQLPTVWADPKTDIRLKKRIVRALIEEVAADTDDSAGQVSLVIRWHGGVHTALNVRRRRRGWNSAHTSPDVVQAVRELSRICNDARIANHLNCSGFHTGHGHRWTCQSVVGLRSRRQIACHCPERQAQEGWMNLTEAARVLRVAARTLRCAIERHEIPALHPVADGPWILNKKDLLTPAAQRITQRAESRYRRGAVHDSKQVSLFPSTT